MSVIFQNISVGCETLAFYLSRNLNYSAMDNKEPIIDGADPVLVHSNDHLDASQADEGLQTLRVMVKEQLHLDDATSKRLKRKADMLMMPVQYLFEHMERDGPPDKSQFLCLVYGVQFLDSR